jgi:hypothetical protein
MKNRMLLLAAILTIAAWAPAPSSADACPAYSCAQLTAQCQGAGGTVLSLNASNDYCELNGRTYRKYTLLCQVPPATFWDDVCYQ